MKKLLFVFAVTALFTAPAFAADMPVKAPLYKMPVPAWTGFYIGGNVGYSWGKASTTIAETADISGFSPIGTSNFLLNDSGSATLKGAIAGAQIGRNYQISPNALIGFEADIQWSGARGGNLFADSFSGTQCTTMAGIPLTCIATGPISGTITTAYHDAINWFGTVRGRAGLLLTDQVLLYGTGGLAYGRVQLVGSSTITAVGNIPFLPGGGLFAAEQNNVGYVVGGGMEVKALPLLPSAFSLKLEYLFLDLGGLSAQSAFSAAGLFGANAIPRPLPATVALHSHFRDNIVRVGLNYQFNDSAIFNRY